MKEIEAWLTVLAVRDTEKIADKGQMAMAIEQGKSIFKDITISVLLIIFSRVIVKTRTLCLVTVQMPVFVRI